MKQLIFVCTGNTCRSPMAEALFRVRIGEKSEWKVSSAGISAANGQPASDQAVEVLKELDIDLSNHISRPLTADMALSADMIVTMTQAHKESILHHLPELEEKVFLIKSFGSSKVCADLSDPFGGSLNVYRKTRDEIDRAISDLILFLLTGN